jgi:ribosomal protein L17
VAQLRSALLRAVSSGDLRAVVKKMVDLAKAGDVPAARVVLDRLLGPVVPLDFEERLAELEKGLAEENKSCNG